MHLILRLILLLRNKTLPAFLSIHRMHMPLKPVVATYEGRDGGDAHLLPCVSQGLPVALPVPARFQRRAKLQSIEAQLSGQFRQDGQLSDVTFFLEECSKHPVGVRSSLSLSLVPGILTPFKCQSGVGLWRNVRKHNVEP